MSTAITKNYGYLPLFLPWFVYFLVFGIKVVVVVVVLKKLFYKKYFSLRLVWKNICLVKTMVEIEVKQKVV